MVDPQHLQRAGTRAERAVTVANPAPRARVGRPFTDKGPPLLEIVDCGPGIPPKVAAQIFYPFFTTSEYGTGLGLYLAKQMCESSQAALEYVPVAGGGACFRITLSPAASLVTTGATAKPATRP